MKMREGRGLLGRELALEADMMKKKIMIKLLIIRKVL